MLSLTFVSSIYKQNNSIGDELVFLDLYPRPTIPAKVVELNLIIVVLHEERNIFRSRVLAHRELCRERHVFVLNSIRFKPSQRLRHDYLIVDVE